MLRVASIKIGDSEEINKLLDRGPLTGRSFSSKDEMLLRLNAEERTESGIQDDRKIELKYIERRGRHVDCH
jgi:hypothetical protein